MNGEQPFEKMRREFEQMMGFPRGTFDPGSPFVRDFERINQALGETVVRMEAVFGQEQLKGKMEAAIEYPVRMASDVPRQLLRVVAPALTDGRRPIGRR